jgi:hypothetical protein
MTDIEQQEFAVLEAVLTAMLEFLVVEANWEGFREEMLYHVDKQGQIASASLGSRKVFAPQTALRQHIRRRDSGYGGINRQGCGPTRIDSAIVAGSDSGSGAGV